MEADLALEGAILDHSQDVHDVLTEEQIAALNNQRDFALFDQSFDSSSDDMFLATSTPQTVSPQELSLDASNPPSSALTNMSTPGMDYEHSPFMRNESALLTPASGGPLNYLDGELDPATMYSLFPGEEGEALPTTEAFPDHSPMSRTASTEEAYAATHAAINGVKSRSRSKPLPAIEADSHDDAVTDKRKRNTLAARKSREKKQSILSGLESEVSDLKALVAQWKHRAEAAEAQVRDMSGARK